MRVTGEEGRGRGHPTFQPKPVRIVVGRQSSAVAIPGKTQRDFGDTISLTRRSLYSVFQSVNFKLKVKGVKGGKIIQHSKPGR